jgi:hypothetical protein
VLRGLMAGANALIARPMLGAADQVVFISETVARHFASVGFKAPPQIVFNGVDTDLFRLPEAGFDTAATRARFDLPAVGPVALFVGRFRRCCEPAFGAAWTARSQRGGGQVFGRLPGASMIDGWTFARRWPVPALLCWGTARHRWLCSAPPRILRRRHPRAISLLRRGEVG